MYVALEVYIAKGISQTEEFVTLNVHFCRQLGEANRCLQGRVRASSGWADPLG